MQMPRSNLPQAIAADLNSYIFSDARLMETLRLKLDFTAMLARTTAKIRSQKQPMQRNFDISSSKTKIKCSS